MLFKIITHNFMCDYFSQNIYIYNLHSSSDSHPYILPTIAHDITLNMPCIFKFSYVLYTLYNMHFMYKIKQNSQR